MKKSTILLITVLFMLIGYAAYNTTVNIYGLGKLSENISDFKVYLSNLKVNGAEISGINNAKDEFTISDINGDVTVDIINASTEYDTEAYLECDKDNTWTFDYTGGEQIFTAPIANSYKLEVWGAQGGGVVPGYGGYSTGQVSLSSNENIYVVVGGAGIVSTDVTNGGGYNGGGHGTNVAQPGSGGGGATHIASTNRGLLSNYASSINEILIVSGGGGGSATYYDQNSGTGGSGGGYLGVNGGYYQYLNYSFYGTGGSQTSGGVCYLYDDNLSGSSSFGTFGQGGNHGYESDGTSNYGGSGGGGGFYGGGGSSRGHGQAGGGSGYIGNTLLSEKSMYCYNCTESSEVSTKTISTTCVNETATANCAKSGNGYARITLLSSPTNIETDKVTIIAQESTNQSIKSVTGKTLTCKLKLNKLSRTEKVYTGQREWTFDYTGEEQTFIAPVNGTYKLETWGASGGYSKESTYLGGYGGYATGQASLNIDQKVYINVGGRGENGTSATTDKAGGYNGGGYSYHFSHNDCFSGSGGGATHMSLSSGLLVKLENKKSDILIVSGGGGGAGGDFTSGAQGYSFGGSGGGMNGGDSYNIIGSLNSSYGYGGTQSQGGLFYETNYSGKEGQFGKGADSTSGVNQGGSSAGGGFYGGGSGGGHFGAGGGSGYIGNSLLSEKSMYCYNCTESTEESTKTISTTCTNTTPTEKCAKQGNGYARITLISLN